MPALEQLRYLAVYGRPVGSGRVVFELSVLDLFLKMEVRAKGEEKRIISGYGIRQLSEKARYFDVWIEGELEEPSGVPPRMVSDHHRCLFPFCGRSKEFR